MSRSPSPLHPAPVALRDATPDDAPFLLSLYASTRAAELARFPWSEAQKEAFVRMQWMAQDRAYRAQYPDADVQLVLVGNEPAGRLYVSRDGARLHVVDISLAPAHRGAGIGTRLLRDLQLEAARRGHHVVLYVEMSNDARRLYERLGFAPVGAPAAPYQRMEWRASTDAPSRG